MSIPARAGNAYIDDPTRPTKGSFVRLLVTKLSLVAGTIARVEADLGPNNATPYTLAPEPHPAKAVPIPGFAERDVQHVTNPGGLDPAFFNVTGINTTADIMHSANPLIRLFTVGNLLAPQPQMDFVPYPGQPTTRSHIGNDRNFGVTSGKFPVCHVAQNWTAATPESVGGWPSGRGSMDVFGGSYNTSKHFSAVCYYFGLDLQRQLGVPVGLVHSSHGGSALELWMDKETLQPFNGTVPAHNSTGVCPGPVTGGCNRWRCVPTYGYSTAVILIY